MAKNKTTTFQPSINQLNATNKAYLQRREMNDNELSEKIKLSKVTFYTRLRKSNWDDKEILYLEYQTNPEFKKIVDSLNIIDA